MRAIISIRFHGAFVGLSLAVLAACGGSSGGDGGGGGGVGVTYTVGGTVTGLAGSGLVLQKNGGHDLAVSADGSFTFTASQAIGTAYVVTVKTQPSSPTQDCVVTNGSGTVGALNVTDVAVACSTLTAYTVGGMVTGLTGSGLELDYYDFTHPPVPLAVSTAGTFTFSVSAYQGAGYQVAVGRQPSSPTQDCLVTNRTGVFGTANVTDILVECVGVAHFAYVANAGDNTISEYSINPTSGALAAVGTPVATDLSPYAIAGSPDKQHVYVVNRGSNNISAYAVDATSGELTQIAGSPFAAGTDPQALVFDRSGAYLYVADAGSNDLSAYSVDAATGVLTPQPTATYATGTGPSAVAIDRAGKFVFVANNGGSNDISVFAITEATGELTPVTGSPFAASESPDLSPRSLVYVDSEGVLYVSTFETFLGSDVTRFRVDQVTGALTLRNSYGIAVDNYIAADREGGILYVTTAGAVVGYAILDAGELFTLSGYPKASGANAYSVTVEPSNQFLYVANDGAGTVSGYKRNGGALIRIPGSPFAAGHNPDFIAVL